MEFNLANNLSKELQININNIVREYWEIFILNKLYASSLSGKLIFKGGTALRLIYRSPRFSEDLDFSLLKSIKFNQFESIIKKITDSQKELSIKDLHSKHYTYFALINFKQDYLERNLSIKVEISKKLLMLNKPKDFKSTIAVSPCSNFKPLVQVFTLERIFRDKCEALRTRSKARDLFDFWLVTQLLHRDRDVKMPHLKMSAKAVKQELHKLLPKNYYHIVPELIKYDKIK